MELIPQRGVCNACRGGFCRREGVDAGLVFKVMDAFTLRTKAEYFRQVE